MNVLFIFPRRGMFQLTRCNSCGYVFECEHCSNKLTAYRASTTEKKLQLICNQCQTSYTYPHQCTQCGSHDIFSRFGGIDELMDQIQTLATNASQIYSTKVFLYRLDKGEVFLETTKSKSNSTENFDIQIQERTEKQSLISSHIINDLLCNEDLSEVHIASSTRLYDPAIEYSSFDRIIYVQAENLLASPDWLVTEDVYKSLFEVFYQSTYRAETKIIFDTNSSGLPLFVDLMRLNSQNPEHTSLHNWHTEFITNELASRQKYSYPPYNNIILLTTQAKTETQSTQLLTEVTKYLQESGKNMPEISWSSPYPAKFLKRKGMYSHHLAIRYPRQYREFFQLRNEITKLADLYRIQVRLNPRHLF
jgi:primosomal protein N' (replication factor Y) (superfamily II helicase)